LSLYRGLLLTAQRARILPPAPLAAYQVYRESTVDSLVRTVECRLAAKWVKTPAAKSLDAWANHYKLSSGEFWFCSYGEPVTLTFAESDYFRIQFQYAGAGLTRCGRRETAVTVDQACVSSAAATIDFGPGFQQLAWRVNREILGRKLTALTGRPMVRSLEFNPAMKLSGPHRRGLAGILDCALQTIAGSVQDANAFVIAELEQALIVSLLTGSDHNCRHLLDAPVNRIAASVSSGRSVAAHSRAWGSFEVRSSADSCSSHARPYGRSNEARSGRLR
jgi:hypothetical protein